MCVSLGVGVGGQHEGDLGLYIYCICVLSSEEQTKAMLCTRKKLLQLCKKSCMEKSERPGCREEGEIKWRQVGGKQGMS